MSNTPEQNRLHKTISYVKSAIRIAGCFLGVLAFTSRNVELICAAFVFIGVAEVLGVIEEMVVD
jgi:hypothetical protein